MAFDFGAVGDMTWIRDRLRACFGSPAPIPARAPIDQLVRSSISGRTYDHVSWGAYRRLVETYPAWSGLAGATRGDIETTIGDVTFPDVKARQLHATINIIAARQPDFDLTFLGKLDVETALAWLERLPGVGRKVSASTLNFSTLQMPAFVVDSHVLRVMGRFGFVRSKSETETTYEVAMAIISDWNAGDLVELHILMKHLGQTLCHKHRPCCRDCPINERCHASPVRSQRHDLH